MNVVDALKLMRTKPVDIRSGICCNISELLQNEHWKMWFDYKSDFLRSWEHYSGVAAYPVPGTTIRGGEVLTPYDEYYRGINKGANTLWEGEQLKMRLSLLDHLIKCFREI